MTSPEQPPRIDISQATLWKRLRLGEVLTQFTRLEPPDQQTQETLDNLQKHLTHGSILVPIYHSTGKDFAAFDMANAARFLTHHLDLRCIITPGAAGDLRHPLYGKLLSSFSNHPGIHLFPVARDHRELKNPKLRDRFSFLLHSIFNRKVLIFQNRQYIETAIRAIKESWPRTMIFSAACNPASNSVYKGMKKLLTLNPHIGYCASLFNPPDNQYYTFLSEPDPSETTPGFSRQLTYDQINKIVSQSRQALFDHAQNQIPTLTPDSSPKKGDYLSALGSRITLR